MHKRPQIYTLTPATRMDTVIQAACAVLKQGGVIVCATDTGYLLGVDGLNISAIEKIYQIKGRSFDKPIHLVAADIAMAASFAELSPLAETVFQRFLPGPLTVIVKRKANVPDLLVSGLDTVGIRIPQNEFLLQLVKAANTPITATSANRSGNVTPYSVQRVFDELGDAVHYVDMIVDQGETRHVMPSTILDLSQTSPRILREGPVTAEMLADVCMSETVLYQRNC